MIREEQHLKGTVRPLLFNDCKKNPQASKVYNVVEIGNIVSWLSVVMLGSSYFCKKRATDEQCIIVP